MLTPLPWLQIHPPTIRTRFLFLFVTSNLPRLPRCWRRPSSPLPCSCSCRPAALQSGHISPRSAGTPSLRCSRRASSSRSFAATRSTRCRISSARSSASITPRSEWLCGKPPRFSSQPLLPCFTPQTAPKLCRNSSSDGKVCICRSTENDCIYLYTLLFFFFLNLLLSFAGQM